LHCRSGNRRKRKNKKGKQGNSKKKPSGTVKKKSRDVQVAANGATPMNKGKENVKKIGGKDLAGQGA